VAERFAEAGGHGGGVRLAPRRKAAAK
jgi:hypothetical protein